MWGFDSTVLCAGRIALTDLGTVTERSHDDRTSSRQSSSRQHSSRQPTSVQKPSRRPLTGDRSRIPSSRRRESRDSITPPPPPPAPERLGTPESRRSQPGTARHQRNRPTSALRVPTIDGAEAGGDSELTRLTGMRSPDTINDSWSARSRPTSSKKRLSASAITAEAERLVHS